MAMAIPTQPKYVITDEDKKRVQQIENAWKAYDGDLEPPLQKMPGQPDDNVLSNRMRAIVDRGVDFLFGRELEITPETSAPGEAKDLLNRVWGRKEARIPLLQKLAMNGAICGQPFLRIVPGNGGTYRLVAIDPSIVYVQTMPQDKDTVLLYCIEYSTFEQIRGKSERVFYREEIERVDPMTDDNDSYEDTNPDGIDADVTWQIQHWSRVGDRGNWTPSGEPIVWPYPFAPLFSCQNLPNPRDFWGKPDITQSLINVNMALNLVQSNINRVNKIYGSPILYANGMSQEDVVDISPGRIKGLPALESKITAVNIVSDIANALSFASNLRSDIDEESGVPGVATGRLTDMPRGNVSGIAIELLFMPLNKKTDKKRCSYGELIIDVSQALLVLNGMNGMIDIALLWQDPLPHDDLPAVQAAVAKQPLGISNTTLQRELGYDPEEELKLNKIEAVQKQVMSPPITPPTPIEPPMEEQLQPAMSTSMMGGQSGR